MKAPTTSGLTPPGAARRVADAGWDAGHSRWKSGFGLASLLALGGKLRPVAGRVAVATCGGCSALVYSIPPRVVAVVASIGFTGWVGQIVGCSVAPGVASG